MIFKIGMNTKTKIDYLNKNKLILLPKTII